MSSFKPIVAILVITYLVRVNGLNNGLAITPHMGYNTWNCYAGDSRCRVQNTLARCG